MAAIAVITAGTAYLGRRLPSSELAIASAVVVGSIAGFAIMLASRRHDGTARFEWTGPASAAADPRSIAIATFDLTPPFDTLPASLKEHMAESAEIEVWAAGERVVEQGAPADSCFIVRRGRLSVHLAGDDAEIQVASLRDGDLFGEMSLLTGEARWATVRAERESEVVRIRASALRKALTRSPELVHVLAETVSVRRDQLLRARVQAQLDDEKRGDLAEAIQTFLRAPDERAIL